MTQQKFCSYGLHFRPIENVRLRRNRVPGAPPSYICDVCSDKRKMSRAQIDALTEREKNERTAARNAHSRKAAQAQVDKRKQEP